MSSVLVVIPTYNESESIKSLLTRLDASRKVISNSFVIDILLVDDSSPDKTAQIASAMNLSNFSVLNRSQKSGLGPAYLAGFKQGLIGDYQYFVEMDADLSHQPEQLVDLLKAASANSTWSLPSKPFTSFAAISSDSIFCNDGFKSLKTCSAVSFCLA